MDSNFKKKSENSESTKSLYETSKEKLLSLGYSRAEADKLILRLSSSDIDFLLNKHAKLRGKNLAALFQLLDHQARMTLVQQYALPLAELLKLLSHNGRWKSLDALLQLLEHEERMILLQQHGLRVTELLKLLSHDGGSKNLEALLQLLEHQSTHGLAATVCVARN